MHSYIIDIQLKPIKMVKNDLRYSLSIEIGKFQLIFYYKCWTCQEKNAWNLSRSGQQGDHHHRNHFLLQTFVRELQTSRDNSEILQIYWLKRGTKYYCTSNYRIQDLSQPILHKFLTHSEFCQLESVEQSCSSYRVNLIAEM